jgi:hypothetical protein
MGSPSFADVLTDALRSYVEPTPAATTAPRPLFASPPPHPFLFVEVPDVARARAVFAIGTLKGAVHTRRPARVLTAAQWQSLACLNTLGARLTPDFTLDELRRSYRWLARRLHPDRQHECDEAERRHRARQFAEATGHYRRLLAFVDPR